MLDVAHNPHAVAALAQNLDQMGFFPRTHAVFGAMRDKDIAAILARMAPLVDAWHFTDLPTPRAASADELAAQSCARAGPEARTRPSATHADPGEALAAARAAADPADRIVVFGSFYTVGGVLAQGLPRQGRPPRRLSARPRHRPGSARTSVPSVQAEERSRSPATVDRPTRCSRREPAPGSA